MEVSSVFAFRPALGNAQTAVDKVRKRGKDNRRIGSQCYIHALRRLNVAGVFVNGYSNLKCFGDVGSVEEVVVDVRGCEYSRGAAEGILKGSNIMKISFHKLDALRNPLLGGGRRQISGDASDVPAFEIEKGICDRGPLVFL